MRAILGATLCLLAASLFSQEMSGTEAAQAKVLALENAWNLAEAHKDARALEQLMANSLIYIDYDGTLMSKTQFLANVKAAAKEEQKIVTESMTVQIHGKTAIVTGIYRDTGMAHGKPYALKGRFLDVWVEENGNWQCVAAQATLVGKGN